MTNFFRLPDREKNFQSYMLYLLAMTWTIVTGLIVSIELYFFSDLWLWWLGRFMVTVCIAVFSISLERLGYTRAASWFFIVTLWLSITVPCYSTGGILATGILSQMSVILAAGFLLGWRGGLAIGLLTVGVDFGFAYLEVINALPQPSISHNPILRWVSGIIPFGTMLVLQFYATNSLRSSLKALKQEIAKREAASEALRVSEERYKSILTVSNTGAWEYHLDTDRIWYSSQYFAMIGLNRPDGNWDDALDESWVERLHPDDREQSVKAFDDFLRMDSMNLYENTFRMRHQNGEWIWILSRGRRLRGINGDLTNITLGTHIDISERIKAEEQVKQSEQLIRKITSQVPANTYMFEIEETGVVKILFVNRGTDTFNHSYNLQDLVDRPGTIREIVHGDDKIKFNDAMKEAFRTQEMLSLQYRMVVNGHVRWRWMQAVPEKVKDGKIIWYGATSDITPLIDYIVSVEQIIFDIGHVIRRPISSMLGMTKLIIDNQLSGEEIKEVSKKLYAISEEMDRFSDELNQAYLKKSQARNFNVDLTSLIDKRGSLFT